LAFGHRSALYTRPASANASATLCGAALSHFLSARLANAEGKSGSPSFGHLSLIDQHFSAHSPIKCPPRKWAVVSDPALGQTIPRSRTRVSTKRMKQQAGAEATSWRPLCQYCCKKFKRTRQEYIESDPPLTRLEYLRLFRKLVTTTRRLQIFSFGPKNHSEQSALLALSDEVLLALAGCIYQCPWKDSADDAVTSTDDVSLKLNLLHRNGRFNLAAPPKDRRMLLRRIVFCEAHTRRSLDVGSRIHESGWEEFLVGLCKTATGASKADDLPQLHKVCKPSHYFSCNIR
jgi:hypothetical protein